MIRALLKCEKHPQSQRRRRALPSVKLNRPIQEPHTSSNQRRGRGSVFSKVLYHPKPFFAQSRSESMCNNPPRFRGRSKFIKSTLSQHQFMVYSLLEQRPSQIMTDSNSTPTPLNFDPDALREKYRFERDKRLRPEGNAQYHSIDGEFSNYVDDPYVTGIPVRAPLNDEVDVVIIGGGFGGLISAARLLEGGIGKPAIPNLISTCHFAKNSTLSPKKSTPMHRKYSSTVITSRNTMTSTTAPASKLR